jgi:hypothetical protein
MEQYQHFKKNLLLPSSPSLKMEAAGFFKMLVLMYKIIWHHIPEECDLKNKEMMN